MLTQQWAHRSWAIRIAFKKQWRRKLLVSWNRKSWKISIYKDLFCRGKFDIPNSNCFVFPEWAWHFYFCFRMGSFTSAPKILNNDDQDDDLHIPSGITRKELLQFCRSQPNTHGLLTRNFRRRGSFKEATHLNNGELQKFSNTTV